MVDVKSENIGDWAKTNTMKLADESYRGLNGYEIKLEDGKLRKATKTEVDTHKQVQETSSIISQRKKALETIGLTEADVSKLKSLEVTPK
jgi:hypothetical protein